MKPCAADGQIGCALIGMFNSLNTHISTLHVRTTCAGGGGDCVFRAEGEYLLAVVLFILVSRARATNQFTHSWCFVLLDNNPTHARS
jgi:hypothetical protein